MRHAQEQTLDLSQPLIGPTPVCPRSSQSMIDTYCYEPCGTGYLAMRTVCTQNVMCPGGPAQQDASFELCFKSKQPIMKIAKMNGVCPIGTIDMSSQIFEGDPCFQPCSSNSTALDLNYCYNHCEVGQEDDFTKCVKPSYNRVRVTPLCPAGYSLTDRNQCLSNEILVMQNINNGLPRTTIPTTTTTTTTTTSTTDTIVQINFGLLIFIVIVVLLQIKIRRF